LRDDCVGFSNEAIPEFNHKDTKGPSIIGHREGSDTPLAPLLIRGDGAALPCQGEIQNLS